MKPVHVSILLDRSGSMGSIADDTVGGFNSFLAKQRAEEGEARVSLVQFDSQDPFEVLIDGIPIQEVTDLDRDSYIPRATTPLLDAVGRLIARCDNDIKSCSDAGMPEEDQVVVVITDGLENASREFSRQAIFDLITKRREQGWVFLFLGADQDVWAEGGRFGFSTHDRVAWEKTQKGSEKMWKDLAYSTGEYRRMGESERSKRRDSFHQEEDSEE